MQSAVAKWLVVALLAVVATCLLIEVSVRPSAGAPVVVDDDQRRSATRGTFAVAGRITQDTYGLYLVDPAAGSICLYQWQARERTLRLLAARTYVYDRQLDAYNTKLEPAEVRKLVAQQQRLSEAPSE
ncbi:MAG: hypothetical protein KGY99_08295 [Phycisphaerae bacterium]|nr:hypothetical protein [Phycisphaerae bacterium]